MNLITRWIEQKALSISNTKSTLVAFTKRTKLEGLKPQKLRGKEINLKPGGDTRTQICLKPISKQNKTEKSLRLNPNMMYWLYIMMIKLMMHPCLVAKMKQATAVNRLGRVQTLACQGIVRARRTTPAAALEILLKHPPLHL